VSSEVGEELVISTSISVASGSLTSSVHDIGSIWSGKVGIEVEVVCWLSDCC